MIQVLSIDPGETTGYAWVQYREGQPTVSLVWRALGVWNSIEQCNQHLPVLLSRAQKLMCSDGEPAPPHVVVEDFRIYPHMASTLIGNRIYTAKELGRIELLCYQQDPELFRHMTYQMAAHAKQSWPDDRMRKWFPQMFQTGWNGSISPHSRDAARHALHFIESHLGEQFFNLEEAI